MNAGVRVIRPPWGRSAHVRAESRWVRFSVRMSTVVLVALGLAMLAVGIWVEDRSAVAAPLVIIGALAVVAGVIFGEWPTSSRCLSPSRASP